MSNPLANTVFSTGAKDSLATADIYNVKNKNVINSIQTISQKLGIDVSSLLNFGKADFSNILSLATGGVKIDTNALTARLLGTSSSLVNSFRTLESDAKNQILGTLPNNSFDQIAVEIGEVQSICKASDFSNLNSLGTFVNSYTKTSLYNPIDNDAISSLLSGVMKQGAALGINGLYSNLTSGITDNKLLSKIVSKSLPGFVKGGDLHSVSSIADGIFGHSLDFIYPNLANDLAKAYGFKGIMNVLDPRADYHSVLNILFKTNSQWDVFIRENGYSGDEMFSIENCVSIVKIQNASKDFQQLLLSGIKTESEGHRRKMYALTQNYKKTDMVSEIKRCFPMVAISNDKNYPLNTVQKKNKTVDPRVLLNITAKALTNTNFNF